MGAMASQITSLRIVYTTFYSGGRRSKKTSKLRITGLCAGNSPGAGEVPAQMASNAENGSIWWRHHGHRCEAIVLCEYDLCLLLQYHDVCGIALLLTVWGQYVNAFHVCIRRTAFTRLIGCITETDDNSTPKKHITWSMEMFIRTK